MTTINDGGPAFPQHGWSKDPEMVERMQAVRGLSLRDYFAAHAPEKPLFIFKPVMPTPRPKPQWSSGEDRARGLDAINDSEIAAWDIECERQAAIQWRWFYADAMLAARGTVEPRNSDSPAYKEMVELLFNIMSDHQRGTFKVRESTATAIHNFLSTKREGGAE